MDDLKLAVADLKAGLDIDPKNKSILSQLQQILKAVDLKSTQPKAVSEPAAAKTSTMEEFVKRTIKSEMAKSKIEEKKGGREIVTANQKKKDSFQSKVQRYIKSKEIDFSFEVKTVREKFPEIEEIRETIQQGEEAIELYAKLGKAAEARQLQTNLEHAKYEIEMLDCVMNLDFSKPKEKAKREAKEMGIDLADPAVIREFQKIQNERLNEMRNAQKGRFWLVNQV